MISKVEVITPPERVLVDKNRISIFLAGSIEMGQADEWQSEFIKNFTKEALGMDRNFQIFNPRRSSFDPTVKQTIKDPIFYQQVDWEMDYLENCSARVFYFAKDTLSPISLLEYGTFFKYPNTYICAHPDYLRRGNLEIFTYKHDIPLYSDFDEIFYRLKWG